MFSVARQTRCFKLWSKLGWIYIRDIIIRISEGIFAHTFFMYVMGYVECSILAKSYCILVYVAAIKLTHKSAQTVSLYDKSSVCQDSCDVSSCVCVCVCVWICSMNRPGEHLGFSKHRKVVIIWFDFGVYSLILNVISQNKTVSREAP